MPKDSPSTGRSSWAKRLPFFYGWVIVAVAFITMGIGVNTRTTFSLLFPPILEEFGWGYGMTAAAFSVGFLASTLFAPFAGIAIDRFGPRIMIPVAAVFVSGGLMLATYATQPWHLYLTLGVLVVGTGIILTYIGHATFLPNWFIQKRGFAVGLAYSGVGVASILILPWLQEMIVTIGWREACWTLALLVLIVIVPINLLLQRRRPQDVGLEPDGDGNPAKRNKQTHIDGTVDERWTATDWTLRLALRTDRFWWLFAGYFCALFAWYAVQVHQTNFLIELGFAPETAAYALGLVALLGIGGQIGLGHLSDRVGREVTWTLGCTGFLLSYVLLLALPDNPSFLLLYLMVACQGLLGHGLAPIYAAIPAELFQGRRYGAILGTLSLTAGLGAACGPWVTGVFYDSFGGYSEAFILAAALCVVSMFCIWIAAPRKVRLVAGQAARRHKRQNAAASTPDSD